MSPVSGRLFYKTVEKPKIILLVLCKAPSNSSRFLRLPWGRMVIWKWCNLFSFRKMQAWIWRPLWHTMEAPVAVTHKLRFWQCSLEMVTLGVLTSQKATKLTRLSSSHLPTTPMILLSFLMLEDKVALSLVPHLAWLFQSLKYWECIWWLQCRMLLVVPVYWRGVQTS